MQTGGSRARPGARSATSPSLLLLFLLLAAGACARRPATETTTWPALGTFASVTAAGEDRAALGAFSPAAADSMSEIEQALSIYNPESEVSRLNRAPPGEYMRVSEHTGEVLRLALHYARLSNGAFDPTVAPLVSLWGFHGGAVAELPPADRLREARNLIGYQHLRVREGPAAARAVANLRVDLGGIAKGYAVDVCWQRLTREGARNIMVNLGGNIRCAGAAAPGRPWRIGIRHPFQRSRQLGYVELQPGEAVATSGNYERFVEIEGQRYAHIVDPRTGWPVQGMAGVTVIAPTAVEADAVSTALFVLGPDEGTRVLRELTGCAALFVPDEKPLRMLATPGFAARFAPEPALRQALEVLR